MFQSYYWKSILPRVIKRYAADSVMSHGRTLNKVTKSFFGRCVQSRNIIVVTEDGVQHYPISPKLQWAGVISIISVFCFVSYASGSYMAAKSVLREKDQKIVSTDKANKRMLSEFSLLKRDLAKLSQQDGKMKDYDKFIISQYTEDKDSALSNLSLSAGDDSETTLMERISFLEKKINTLEATNEAFVDAIRERTQERIDNFEDIIKMTGLNTQKLKNLAQDEREPLSEEDAASLLDAHFDSQGGPFIPDDLDSLSGKEKELFMGLEQMMLLNDIVDALPLGTPIRNAELHSHFGRRVDPISHRMAVHSGVDLAGPKGSIIYATNDGKVTYSGYYNAYGNMVDIEHEYGIVTRYGHMSRIIAKEGQHVKKGQAIGIQGSTGRSTGQHVHYEVRYDDRPYNPMKFIKAGEHVLKD